MPVLRQCRAGGVSLRPSMDLSEEQIRQRLAGAYTPGVLASTDGYADLLSGMDLKCAAVLILFTRQGRTWSIVFTRRTDQVEHHKGQVSFPGGACDPGEASPEQTALREAEEEIGLKRADVRLLGRLNDVATITGYRVTPVVGVMPSGYPLVPAPQEVERIFTIPLTWLAQGLNREERSFTPGGEQRPFPVVIYHAYDGEVLWGASARILLNLLEVLAI